MRFHVETSNKWTMHLYGHHLAHDSKFEGRFNIIPSKEDSYSEQKGKFGIYNT